VDVDLHAAARGPDIHANTTGYVVIAQAFADQLTP
jgi:hypothetical protein